jgi:hypothetical protein
MVERRLDRSRRRIVGAVAAAMSAGLWSRLGRAQTAEKMTRAQAEYQVTPNGIYSCGVCTLFMPPNACKVVAGEVSEEGWCKAFALAD